MRQAKVQEVKLQCDRHGNPENLAVTPKCSNLEYHDANYLEYYNRTVGKIFIVIQNRGSPGA